MTITDQLIDRIAWYDDFIVDNVMQLVRHVCSDDNFGTNSSVEVNIFAE